MAEIIEVSLDLIDFDERNARQHNPRNIGMIEQSLREVGAGRSVLLVPKSDGRWKCIAGEGTITAARQAGMDTIQIIQKTGHTLTGVARTDLDEQQQVRAALFDNRANETSAFEPFMLWHLADEFDGILDGLFNAPEMADLMRIAANAIEVEGPGVEASDREIGMPGSGQRGAFTNEPGELGPEKDNSIGGPASTAADSATPPIVRARYPLAIVLDHEGKRRWDKWKETCGSRQDTNAFLALLDEVFAKIQEAETFGSD